MIAFNGWLRLEKPECNRQGWSWLLVVYCYSIACIVKHFIVSIVIKVGRLVIQRKNKKDAL